MFALVALGSIYFVISFPIFVYWAIIFLIRIYNSRKYVRSATRFLRDEDSAYLCEQICYHYRTEMRKYIFLLVITIVEITGGISYYIEFLSETYYPKIQGNMGIHVQLEECVNWNYSMLMNIPSDEFGDPSLMALEAIGNVADIFVVGLGVCLMNYLIGRMKHRDTKVMNIKRFILILSAISVLVVLFSFFIFISNLNRAIFLTSLTAIYIMFLLEVKKFKQALIEIAIERLAQHGSNETEMRQYKYFSYSINCICFGFFLITFSAHLASIKHIIISGLFFGDCYFPFNFFSGYESIIFLSQSQIKNIIAIKGYTSTIIKLIASFGVLFWMLPITTVTVCILVRFVWMKIRGVSTVQFRYKVSS